MSLGVYSTPNENSVLSSQKPFTVTFDGRIGGALDRCVYIRNSNTARWYENITIKAVDTSGTDMVDGSQEGFSWKLIQKDIPPTDIEWDEVSSGNTLQLDTDLGNSAFADIITYIPVWIRVQIPRGQNIQTITDIVLRIDAQENAI